MGKMKRCIGTCMLPLLLLGGCCIDPDSGPAKLTGSQETQIAFASNPSPDDSENRIFRSGTYSSLVSSGNGVAATSTDFDEDGIADLITGFEDHGKGSLVLNRGNIQLRRSFSNVSPFVMPATVSNISEPPRFLATGDFDADGHEDLVFANQHTSHIMWMRGDGHGGFSKEQKILLPGEITAMCAGEVGRPDGLAEVAVAVSTQDGAAVLLFQGRSGAFRSSFQTLQTQNIFQPDDPITLMTIAALDRDATQELAVLSGRKIMIWHIDSNPEVIRLPFKPIAMTAGNFHERLPFELAFLSQNGSVFEMIKQQRDKKWNFQRVVETRSQATDLIGARISGSKADDLVVIEPQQISIFAKNENSTERKISRNIPLPVQLLKVLPMQLNSDSLSDLVVLNENSDSMLSVILTQPANTYDVTNTNDSGAGSLRQAIIDADANPGPDAIQFQLPPGDHIIYVSTQLPTITETVTIDADVSGLNVEINGVEAPLVDGLVVAASSCTIRGLTFENFFSAIHLQFSNSNHIEGNLIGTDMTGTQGQGNFNGVYLENSSSNHVGGAGWSDATSCVADCNLISLNLNGILIDGDSGNNDIKGNMIGTDINGISELPNGAGVRYEATSSFNEVHGNLISGNTNGVEMTSGSFSLDVHSNYIGPQTDGISPLGNTRGILIDDSSFNTIGSPFSKQRIAFNSYGVVVRSTSLPAIKNEITENIIHSNLFLGIDLGGDGITPNDPDDADSGPNNLQNFPELTQVIFDENHVHVEGTINSDPANSFYPLDLHFYDNTNCDPTGNGQGERLISSFIILSQPGPFVFDIPVSDPPNLTVTATDNLGNTSEFSACVPASLGGIPEITIDPPRASRMIGGIQSHSFTATITQQEVPLSGVSLSAVITGTNAGAFIECFPNNCMTDSNGKVLFGYASNGDRGYDSIAVSGVANGFQITGIADVKWSIYCSTDVPRTIVPGGITFSTLTITDDFEIGDVNVSMYVRHPFPSNLEIYLDSPQFDGKNQYIFNGTFAGADIGTSCGYENSSGPDSIFDDQANESVGGQGPPFKGTHRPYVTFPSTDPSYVWLSDLRASSSAGEYHLLIDNGTNAIGTLQCWCIEITETIPDCSLDVPAVKYDFSPFRATSTVYDENQQPAPNVDVLMQSFAWSDAGISAVERTDVFGIAMTTVSFLGKVQTTTAYSELNGKAAFCLGNTKWPCKSTDLSIISDSISAFVPEILGIIHSNSEVENQATEIQNRLQPILQEWKETKKARLHQRDLDQIETLLLAIAEKASPELQQEISKIMMQLTDPKALSEAGIDVQ